MVFEEQDLDGPTSRLVRVEAGGQDPAVVDNEQVSAAQNPREIGHLEMVRWAGCASVDQQPGLLPTSGRFLRDCGWWQRIVELEDIHERETGRNGGRR
jgi:hypothetical protein